MALSNHFGSFSLGQEGTSEVGRLSICLPATRRPPAPDKMKKKIVSFQLDERTFDALRRRVPKYGDRSEVLRKLVEKFLNDDIEVKVPARKL